MMKTEEEHEEEGDVYAYDYETRDVKVYHAAQLHQENKGESEGRSPRRVVVGIDEAGRGPVLGPMVYACAFWDEALNEGDGKRYMADYDDSKQLSEARREQLFRAVERDERVGFATRVLHARELSNAMLCGNGKVNLNTLSHNAAIDLVLAVMDVDNGRRFKVTEVFVDTVGDPNKYREKLERAFAGKGVERVTVTSKADSLFKVVSAASIVAKVSRDRILKRWHFDEGDAVVDQSTETGSGYPSDPTTKEWLRRTLDPVFGFPSLVRFSWQTCKTILEEKAVEFVWECEREEEEADGPKKKAKKPRPTGKPPICETISYAPKRHGYFRSRNMQRSALGVDKTSAAAAPLW